MVAELAIRFVVGGALVSVFALLGDLFEPKSFAGLFGAAPSVALATLGLAIHARGAPYAALEARSMIAGAVGLLAYASAVSWWVHRHKLATKAAVLCAFLPWTAVVSLGWVLIRLAETR